MIDIVETTFDDPRGVALRQQMSDEMAHLYGRPRHSVGAEEIPLQNVLGSWLVLDGDRTVGTVSLRRLPVAGAHELVEIKRMFLLPETRGSGLAARLLATVEARAADFTERVVLHTGQRQKAAIALYERSGYVPIDIFPPYDEVPESLCFAKELKQPADSA